MGISDWIRNVGNRYQTQGIRDATVDSAHELYIGGVRRLESVQDPTYESHWNREWDILCILDACRVDLFNNACGDYDWLPSADETETLTSTGSTSREWMQAIFNEKYQKEMTETAYITGNLFAEHADTDSLAYFDIHRPRLLEKKGIYTVPPQELTDSAIQYWRHKDESVDRLIIHYMQPHTPFRSKPEWFDTEADMAGNLRTGWGQGFAELRDGKYTREEFVEAYRDNLDWVLTEVNRLRQNAEGKLALSADHGNGLGEWGVYGHPEGVNIASVREVPFATVEATDTDSCEPEPRAQLEEINEDVSEHLRRLGYKT